MVAGQPVSETHLDSGSRDHAANGKRSWRYGKVANSKQIDRCAAPIDHHPITCLGNVATCSLGAEGEATRFSLLAKPGILVSSNKPVSSMFNQRLAISFDVILQASPD